MPYFLPHNPSVATPESVMTVIIYIKSQVTLCIGSDFFFPFRYLKQVWRIKRFWNILKNTSGACISVMKHFRIFCHRVDPP